LALENLIQSVLNRDGSAGGESTVVALHCQQMSEYGVRGGNVEFFCAQDDDANTRRKAIARWAKDNQISLRLPHIMNLLTCRGELLWLVLPNDSGGYFIDTFSGGLNNPDPEYKVYRKRGGREIEQVVIRYSYESASYIGDMSQPYTGVDQRRWVRIIITQDWIEESEHSTQPSLSTGWNQWGQGGVQVSTNRYPNPFAPALPVEISPANPRRSGQLGSSDFHWMQSLIENHEQILGSMTRNIKLFGNPSMVTTRSASEVTENATGGGVVPTWASNQGYTDGVGDRYSYSTRVADGGSHNGFFAGMMASSTSIANGRKIADIIGGISPDERFAYIQPDPVSGDVNNYERERRESIHWALGGVDPLGIHSGATFGEIKSLYGRVQNHADLLAESLYTFGLCKVFEKIIEFEEQLFKDWLFLALTQLYPKQFKGLSDSSQISDTNAQDIWAIARDPKSPIPLPSDFKGMIPMGDRTVNWRFSKEVYKPTTRDLLDLSILNRNAREDGQSQESCLRRENPDMTDKEIADTMSGFSPRVVDSASNALNTLMQLHAQLMQVPDPENPKAPWALRLGTAQMIEQGLFTIQKEIQYGQPTYDPAVPTQPSPATSLPAFNGVLPNGRNGGDASSDAGSPASGDPTANGAIPAPINYAPNSSAASMAAYGLPPILAAGAPSPLDGRGQSGGLSAGAGKPNFPAPGATVIDTGNSVQSGGYGSFPVAVPATVAAGIPPELASQPALLQLYAAQLAARERIAAASNSRTSARKSGSS
jgi:hypothetical protein